MKYKKYEMRAGNKLCTERNAKNFEAFLEVHIKLINRICGSLKMMMLQFVIARGIVICCVHTIK